MSKIRSITDPEYVCSQYQDASQLNVRIRLHQEFSTNPYGWYRWLFDRFRLTSQQRILELGCGPGNMWLENWDRIPEGVEIVLSDLSAGMLDQTRKNLADHASKFRFDIVNAQELPFEENSIDVIIASFVLQHVPDRKKAISEIRRVLQPTGHFYAGTIGSQHMKELGDLVSRFDAQLSVVQAGMG